MAKQIDSVVANSKQGMSFVVLLDDDKSGAAGKLKAFRTKSGTSKVGLTYNMGGAKSPAGHKLDPKVKHTVLVYKNKKVVHNFAVNKLGAPQVAAITKAAKEVLGP